MRKMVNTASVLLSTLLLMLTVSHLHPVEAGNTVPDDSSLNSNPIKDHPGPPENISLEEGYDYIVISWDPPENSGREKISNYVILRSIDNQNYTLIAEPDGSERSYRDSGLETNRWYYYRIGAENKEGISYNTSVFYEYTYYKSPIGNNIPIRIFTVCGLPLVFFTVVVVIFYFTLKKLRKAGPRWHDGGPVDFSKGGGGPER